MRRLARGLVNASDEVAPLVPDPRDKKELGRRADALFLSHKKDFELGSLERSRQLLTIMADGYPTPLLTDAYFDNLRALFAGRTPLASPGAWLSGWEAADRARRASRVD